MGFSLFGARRNALLNTTPPAPAPAPAANAPAPAGAKDGKADGDSTDSRLAELARLWQDPDNGNGKPANAPSGPQPLFNVDPAKVSEAVGKLNFAANVPQETLQKALNGDAAALMEALNATARTSFQAAVMAVPSMVEPAVRKATGEVSEQLPGLIKHAQLAATRSENSVYNNEALAPVTAALKEQIVKHNPQATPNEVQALVEKQLETLGMVLAPQRQSSSPAAGPRNTGAEQDFSFLQ